ncbi:MAG: FG-GAP repeat protein, partial [Spirochaetales bacterium]|nr:FG-GAP repeat protein [Spirochaetales bacterium]
MHYKLKLSLPILMIFLSLFSTLSCWNSLMNNRADLLMAVSKPEGTGSPHTPGRVIHGDADRLTVTLTYPVAGSENSAEGMAAAEPLMITRNFVLSKGVTTCSIPEVPTGEGIELLLKAYNEENDAVPASMAKAVMDITEGENQIALHLDPEFPVDLTITSFGFSDFGSSWTFDEDRSELKLTLPYMLKDISSLTPIIQHGADSITPESGVSRNFNDSLVYSLSGWEGSSLDVTVSAAQEIRETDYIAGSKSGLYDNYFGEAIATDGEWLFVGAPGKNKAEGVVYAYHLENGEWLEKQRLTPSSYTQTDDYGSAMAFNGNILAVGYPNHLSGTGIVYIYAYDGNQWTEVDIHSGEATSDNYGVSIAFHRDNNLLIGAKGNNSGTGAVYYLKDQGGNSWSETQIITAGQGDGANDFFGGALSCYGDTLAVGAWGYDINHGNDWDGAAYIFSYDGSTWTEVFFLTPADGEQGDAFGTSIALTEGMVFIGAPKRKSGKGGVYVYTVSGSIWIEQ